MGSNEKIDLVATSHNRNFVGFLGFYKSVKIYHVYKANVVLHIYNRILGVKITWVQTEIRNYHKFSANIDNRKFAI